MRATAQTHIAIAIAALAALLVITPLGSIVWLALTPPDDVWPHLVAYVLPQALQDTLVLLVGVMAVASVAGVGPAYLVSRCDFNGRSTLLWLVPLPLAIPTYIAAYVYVDLFEPLGAVHRALTPLLGLRQAAQMLPAMRSMPGAIAIIGIVLAPYVYLASRAALQLQSAEFREAAQSLGASRWAVFHQVTWPSLKPSVIVGLTLVALETLNDFGASEYLGVRTLTVSIFTTWLNRGSLAGAAQIATAMLLVIAVLVVIERRNRRFAQLEFAAESPRLAQRRRLHGAANVGATVACATPVVLGFIVPLGYLGAETWRRSALDSVAGLMRDASHTLLYALLASGVALFIALAIAAAQRWQRSALTRRLAAIAQAGYALPGLVLAIGLLSPVLALDGALNRAASMIGVAKPGLVLVGSGAAVVIAYVVRFLAVPIGFLGSGLQRIPNDYDDSAATVGAGRLTTFRRIHLPLLKPALFGAAIVVFVDCLKELPATLLLRPLNVETLSTSIYQYASRGSFEQGSAAALVIVAASIGPVIWLSRVSDLPQHPA